MSWPDIGCELIKSQKPGHLLLHLYSIITSNRSLSHTGQLYLYNHRYIIRTTFRNKLKLTTKIVRWFSEYSYSEMFISYVLIKFTLEIYKNDYIFVDTLAIIKKVCPRLLGTIWLGNCLQDHIFSYYLLLCSVYE